MKKTRKTTFLFFIILSGYVSGQYKITGNVFNEENISIPYTSVYSAEDSVGTHTDNAGAFHLSVKSLPVRLEFRNVGYKEKVLQVHSSDNLTIQLEEKVMRLDEVIVRGDNEKTYVIGSPKRRRGLVSLHVYDPFDQWGIIVTTSDLMRMAKKIIPRFWKLRKQPFLT